MVMGSRPFNYTTLCHLVSCCLVFLCLGFAAAGDLPSDAVVAEYFSQGRAMVHGENHAMSREEAFLDFLTQAVVQATSRILSPSGMETRYAVLKEKIFKEPGRYVQSYQIFSEGMAGGNHYHVAGRVTVAMEALRGDLMQMDVILDSDLAEESVPPPVSSQESIVESDTDARRDPAGSNTAGPMGGGGVFWAVAERWEEAWHIPHSRTDPQGLFGANVYEELSSIGWSIWFPGEKSLPVNEAGMIPPGDVLRLAKTAGVSRAVVGTVDVRRDDNARLRLATTLVVLDVHSGGTLGEIHKQLPVDEGATLDGTMELAAFVVPNLERLLRDHGDKKTVPPSEQPEPEMTTIREEADHLVLRIVSQRSQADWEALEGILREKSPNLEVTGFKLGENGGAVQLRGVGRATVNALNGMRLQDGGEVKVEEPHSADADVVLTVVHSETSQSNP